MGSSQFSGIDNERDGLLPHVVEAEGALNDGEAASSSSPQQPLESHSEFVDSRVVLYRLYISHSLSAWNSRTFEFGAVIFLASLFPGTLLYASCYALVRSASAVLFSSWVGGHVDHGERLRVVRSSIVAMRLAVAVSCALFVGMLYLRKKEDHAGASVSMPLLSSYDEGDSVVIVAAAASGSGGTGAGSSLWSGSARQVVVLLGFALSVGLAGVEKLAAVGNTVAVERDWAIVISESLDIEREVLNATMRRIDLFCKLIAPVFISLIDGYSTFAAIWVVFGQNIISAAVEFLTIEQVYKSIPQLANRETSQHNQSTQPTSSETYRHSRFIGRLRSVVRSTFAPWKDYIQSPPFLASFALSLLYLTVLSTGMQMSTYLFSFGFSSIHVSLMRLAAVVLELLATCTAPILMQRIGPIRAGLWFINQQVICLAVAVGIFLSHNGVGQAAGLSLISGVAFSRLGLWGFDLSVQFLVQEETPESTRGKFSAMEMALQNLCELISYATTIVFSNPENFKYPVLISFGAVAVSAVCFAAYVRQRRGHLLHMSKCIERAKDRYVELPRIEPEANARLESRG